MNLVLHAVARRAVQCFLFLFALTSLAAPETPVISIVFSEGPLFWIGLNAEARLISVSVDLRQQSIGSWRERPATTGELAGLELAMERGGLMRLPPTYSGPKELASRPPGLPLTRLSLWRGTNAHEISITGLDYAPASLREFVGQMKALTATGESRRPAAAVRSIGLDRLYGERGATYATVFERAGKRFTALPGIDDAPRPIREAVQRPGMFVAIGPGDWTWLSSLAGWQNDSLLLAVGSAHYQFDLWKGTNTSLRLPGPGGSSPSIPNSTP